MNKFRPKELWGRLEQYNNFNRLDITLEAGIDDGLSNKKDGNPVASSKRLKYGNGLFFVFSTDEERLSIKYKFHHSNSDNYAASRRATVEPQLCARKKVLTLG